MAKEQNAKATSEEENPSAQALNPDGTVRTDDPRMDPNQKSYLFDSAVQEAKSNPFLNILTLLILVVGFGGPGYAGYYYTGEVESQITKLAGLNDEVSLLDAQIKSEKEKGQKLIDELKSKIEKVEAPTYKVKWTKVLQDFRNVVKKTIEESNGENIYEFENYNFIDGKMSVTGFTNSFNAYIDLLKAIEASDAFQNVPLVNAMTRNKGDENPVNPGTYFYTVPMSLSFELQPEKTAEEKKAEEEEAKKAEETISAP